MLGAIIGDVIGSRFEFDNYKGKDFELLTDECRPTDDSFMTIAIAAALMQSGDVSANAISFMQSIGRAHIDCGFGGRFIEWVMSSEPSPYESFGNGAAMRISPVGDIAASIEDAKSLAYAVTAVTHNHPEGLKGAEAIAVAIVMARNGASKVEIKTELSKYYDLDFTLDSIRDKYEFDVTCQGSVPQAIVAFLESTDFESAVRNAISIGGDSDTIAAITGSIAEAYYGIPEHMREAVMEILCEYMEEDELKIIDEFSKQI